MGEILFLNFFALFRHRLCSGRDYVKILFSVPVISLFMFSLWRTITIIGIAMAAMSRGQRFVKFQDGVRAITRSNVRGKATEAAMEAREIYRHNETTTAHIKKAAAAQIV